MIKPHQQLVKNLKFLPCLFALLFALVGLSTATPNTHAAGTAPPLPSPTNSQSLNWSGYEAIGSLGTFLRTQCTFKVPTLRSRGEVSLWCGLGGDPVGINPTNPDKGKKQAVLVQAGVDSCLGLSCPGGNLNIEHSYVWWEIADALVVQPISFSQGIHNGDTIYFYITSNLNKDGFDKFFIRNITTKEIHTIIVNSQGATDNDQPIPVNTLNGQRATMNGTSRKSASEASFPIITDGASAECILEVPLDAISGTLANLPSFGSAQISGCDAGVGGNGRWTSIAGLPNLSKIKMFKTVQANNFSRQTNGQQQVFLTDVGKLSCFPYLDCFTVFESNSVSSQVQQSRNSVLQRFIR
jgi:hypothetical protein